MEMKALKKADREIYNFISEETYRQQNTLDLIASENHTSGAVLEAQSSRLTDKYLEGYPGKRYYPGAKWHDKIELLGIKRLLKLFGLSADEWHANIQPISGAIANLAIESAVLEKTDKLMGLKLSAGGHLSHGQKVSFSGKNWESKLYDVNHSTGLLDYDEIERMAIEVRPAMIISGFTAYPRLIDFKRFRKIAEKVGAVHVVDMAHLAGLIAGEAYPSPFPYADIVMTTTHKSLRGPRGAVILCRKEWAERIDKAVFPGLQGGPFGHIHAAKAVCFKEASTAAFRRYAHQIVKNAKALAEELKKFGCGLIAGGTDSHLMLVDVHASYGLSGKEAQNKLEETGILANMNTVPGDEKPLNPSGIRLGTPALTTRGMKEKEMRQMANLIHQTLIGGSKDAIKKEVSALCKKFPIK